MNIRKTYYNGLFGGKSVLFCYSDKNLIICIQRGKSSIKYVLISICYHICLSQMLISPSQKGSPSHSGNSLNANVCVSFTSLFLANTCLLMLLLQARGKLPEVTMHACRTSVMVSVLSAVPGTYNENLKNSQQLNDMSI